MLDEDSLADYLTQYLTMKDAADELTKRVNGMKATLMAYLDEHGIENEKGHKVIVVDGIATIVRERRVSEAFLEDVAERWLKKKGKRDEMIKEVTDRGVRLRRLHGAAVRGQDAAGHRRHVLRPHREVRLQGDRPRRSVSTFQAAARVNVVTRAERGQHSVVASTEHGFFQWQTPWPPEVGDMVIVTIETDVAKVYTRAVDDMHRLLKGTEQ